MTFFVLIFLICLWCIFFKLIKFQINISFSKIKDFFILQAPKELTHFILKSEFNLSVPKYKFFSSIVEELIHSQKKYGTDITTMLFEIRKAIQKDYSKCQKVRSELKGFIFQYLFIVLFTWFFISNIQVSLSISFSVISLLGLFLWQFLGLASGVLIYNIIKKRSFKDYEDYFYTIYLLDCLTQISIPISLIVDKSNLSELTETRKLKHIYDRLFLIIQNLKKFGSLEKEELSTMSCELWDSYDHEFIKFQKFVALLKLFLIMAFVLPGFLFALSLTMNSLAF